MQNTRCPICLTSNENRVHDVRDTFFGETFQYVECRSCGCLLLTEIPKNLARYYQSSYYSMKTHEGGAIMPGWKLWLKRQRTRHLLDKPNFFGGFLARWEKASEWIEGIRHI